jgi:CBS domain containing-hemolysin-like protein
MELFFIALFIFLSAFFNGVEVGLYSVNRIKLLAKLEEGKRSARMLDFLLKNSEQVLGTLLIGSNLCEIMAVIQFVVFLTKQLGVDPLIPLYSTLILTPLFLFVGNLLPKVLFREFADELMYLLAYVCYIVYVLLYPFQLVFVKSVKMILEFLGIKRQKNLFNKDEFNILLDVSAEKGMLKESERDFIESIMNFKNVKAKEIMVPLVRMTCVEENDTVEVASALILSTKHSRLPVFRMRVDNMIGYIENKDLIDAHKHDKVGNYIKETVFVPDLTPIDQVLLQMRNRKTQMAFVVDEYGGAAGVITNQDVIAEIIGELVEIREELLQKEEGAYLANGMMNIDDLNEELKLKIKKNDFETVAGFVLSNFGRVPGVGESFDFGKYQFEVAAANQVRVKSVRISLKKRKKK